MQFLVDYLNNTRIFEQGMLIAPRIECRDGFSISVQASHSHYCSPRADRADWVDVECGYPSQPDELLTPYADDGDNLTDTVYGYVPVEIVERVIKKHGGIVK